MGVLTSSPSVGTEAPNKGDYYAIRTRNLREKTRKTHKEKKEIQEIQEKKEEEEERLG